MIWVQEIITSILYIIYWLINIRITWAIEDKQELIDIVEVIYRGAKKGKGLVIAPRDYSTKHRY